MKTIFTIFGLVGLLAFSSCYVGDEGPVGPVGPRGPEGPQGIPGETGYVFEYTDIDFTSTNNYEVFLNYPDDFETFSTDKVLVYFLWGQEDVNGQLVDIWRQLPQTLIVPEGILQYNFDFTLNDVRLFMDADFSLDMLTADDTDGWIARVVVVPTDDSYLGRIDYSDYNAVKEAFGLPELPQHQNVVNRRK